MLDMARVVHKLLMLLPQELIDRMESEELQWEPTSELGVLCVCVRSKNQEMLAYLPKFNSEFNYSMHYVN